MNLLITSNTINPYRKNYTNKFEMKLLHGIDALNQDKYIEVLQVNYPQTTKNITEDKAFIILKIFIGFEDKYTKPTASEIVNEKFLIPDGFYDLDVLIRKINTLIQEYNISFVKENGKIKIGVCNYVEYWSDLNTSGGDSGFNVQRDATTVKNRTCTMPFKFEIELSEKLSFMVGMEKKFNVSLKLNDNNVELYHEIIGDYLPDISDGINKMFIYCDEIEAQAVGDSISSLLAVVPLQGKGQGTGEIINYSPARSLRKLNKSFIRSFTVTVRDTKGDLIPFDSGTITLECLIK